MITFYILIDSPFQLKICDPINASNVKYFGGAIKPDCVSRIEEPLLFTIDASRAGDAPLKVDILNDNYYLLLIAQACLRYNFVLSIRYYF